MKSKITQGSTTELFKIKVLNKYDVIYYRCNETGFIQTESPYWLSEAYKSAITSLDLGLINRNIASRDVTATIIDLNFDSTAKFLDYGGGYGMFTRMMRDFGYDFYRMDPYCENLFARHFDWIPQQFGKAELLTAWEVFEHIEDPIASVAQMLQYSDNILFSTLLIPEGKITSPNDWWYFIPETGQHISLYSKEAIVHIAQQFHLHFYTDGVSTHLLTRKKISDPFNPKLGWKLRRLRQKIARFARQAIGKNRSLLPTDFELVRSNIGSGSES